MLLEPQGQIVGSVNEDFAIESLAGDVFQLGNTSYRILRVERGTVRVEDAKGAPPGIPFWFGEAPARSEELSQSVSRLRAGIEAAPDRAAAIARLVQDAGLDPGAAEQIVDYLAAARAALGALPTLETVVLERFFDESGGMQLVVHAPFGSRINRAWGLALRKRFCRKFNFELQAAATEDAIILSLSTSHSFELEEVARYLNAKTVRPLLVQALLDAPMFAARWRWNATVALALLRFRGGRKLAPQLQRMEAEDLLAAIFPDQVACGENLAAGDIEIPDHPLVAQTIADCLHEAMDVEGLERVLGGLERGEIRVVARELTEPSPLAAEILSARPYAFLDDAPLEERRTQAVMARRWLDPETAADLGKLDAEAIRRVREEVWPAVRNADELADAIATLAFLADDELRPEWRAYADELGAGATRDAVRTRDLGRRRAAARVRGASPGRIAHPRDRGAAGVPQAVDEGGRAGRDRSRPPAGARPGDCGGARRAARPRHRRRSRRRSRGSRPKARRCAAGSRPTRATPSGASGGSSPASTATRCTGCAPRSSRSRRATSCASSSAGSASRRRRASKGRTRSRRSSRSSRASRRRRRRGRPRSCRRA